MLILRNTTTSRNKEHITLINRVNQVYNDDLGIRMLLVNGTDELNFDTEAKAAGADGPCGSAPCFDPAVGAEGDGDYEPGMLDYCSPGALGRMRTVLGQIIGADAYDLGHLVLGVNGGGVAYLGVVGQDYSSGGCTGLPEPRGDFFAIDYVAHEIGHQFAGNHTFNGTQGRLRRQHRRCLRRAGLRLLGDGLRRHLRHRRPPAAHRPLLLPADHRRGHLVRDRRRCRRLRGADRLAARLRHRRRHLRRQPRRPVPHR